MPKQPAFPCLREAVKKKQRRRELFLGEMDTVVPWTSLLALIAPHCPKAGPKGGRPPMPLEIEGGLEIDPGDRFPDERPHRR